MSRKKPNLNDYADLIWTTIADTMPPGTLVSTSVITSGVEAIVNGKTYNFTEVELKTNASSAKSFIKFINSKIGL